MANNVCVDFDAVIYKYDKGYQNGKLTEEPVQKSIQSLIDIYEMGFNIIILTARPKKEHRKVEKWIRRYLPDEYKDLPFFVTNIKVPAVAYIDDRAIHFISWELAMRELINMIDKEVGNE